MENLFKRVSKVTLGTKVFVVTAEELGIKMFTPESIRWNTIDLENGEACRIKDEKLNYLINCEGRRVLFLSYEEAKEFLLDSLINKITQMKEVFKSIENIKANL